jgi:hypothetical protein
MVMRTSIDEKKILVRRFERAMNERQFDALDEIVARTSCVTVKRRRT